MQTHGHAVAFTACLVACAPAAFALADPENPALAQARTALYSGRYAEAAAQALTLHEAAPEDLEVLELRSSALLFQLKAHIGEPKDRRQAFEDCRACPDLHDALLRDIARAQQVARARLRVSADDETARFVLGKVDLNFVWLNLGVLGRKKGWDEYWEARRTLDALLKTNPAHVRARVARAWIDYIVGTKLPRGTRWLVGGGGRKRGLGAVRAAASAEADVFANAEARFALWEMQVRERNLNEALDVARGLLRQFPSNQDLVRFVQKHEPRPPGAPVGTASGGSSR
jgi:hypothetical protein